MVTKYPASVTALPNVKSVVDAVALSSKWMKDLDCGKLMHELFMNRTYRVQCRPLATEASLVASSKRNWHV